MIYVCVVLVLYFFSVTSLFWSSDLPSTEVDPDPDLIFQYHHCRAQRRS